MTSLLLLLAAGCDEPPGPAGKGTSFQVHLGPVVPTNQTPFDGLDRVDLVIDPARGDPVRLDLGTPVSGESLLAEGLGELVDATLRVEGYRGDALAAWGETEPVSAFDQELDLGVFVADAEAPAWLSRLPEPRAGAQLVARGGGRFLLLGGVTTDRNGNLDAPAPEVLQIDLQPPDADLAFTAVGTLPEWTDLRGTTWGSRAAFTALVIPEGFEDAGKVLIAGGGGTLPILDSRTVTPTAGLYDPETGEWTDIADRQALNTPRAGYVAVLDQNGTGVYYGGWRNVSSANAISFDRSFEFYDPAERAFDSDSSQYEELGALDAAGAAIGADGVLICGGSIFDEVDGDGVADYIAEDGCATVGLELTVSTDLHLPKPLAGHAMVTLASGEVLLTGGAAVADWVESTGRTTGVPAETSAYLYRPGSGDWIATGSLQVARAFHTMVALPDGRALVIGGSDEYDLFQIEGRRLSCIEVFDPDTASFSVIDGCSADDDAGGLAGRAAFPAAAVDPEFGVLVASGLSDLEVPQDAATLYYLGR